MWFVKNIFSLRLVALCWVGTLGDVAHAEFVFGEAQPFPDIGLSFPIPQQAVSVPQELPRAKAFLLSTAEVEDRYDVYGLWLNDAIRGVWRTEKGDVMTVARLVFRPPNCPLDEVRSRMKFYASCQRLDPQNIDEVKSAALLASPFEIREWKRPHRSRRQYLPRILLGETEDPRRVAALFQAKSEVKENEGWYFAAFETSVEKDTPLEVLVDAWLDKVRSPKEFVPEGSLPTDEDGWLQRDYCRNVTNSLEWTFTKGEGCLVVDDLKSMPTRGTFVRKLTEGLEKYRREFVRLLPTRFSHDLHIAAAKIFQDRIQYLAYIPNGAEWSQALWDTARRELVLNIPDTSEVMMQTVWHEALHQYLAYACGFATASPWFNEGHAEFFERMEFSRAGQPEFKADDATLDEICLNLDAWAAEIPQVLAMDYTAFYSGDSELVRRRYHLAWSIAYFLELGAPQVRFQPFRKVREEYLAALIKSRDMLEATRAVFTADLLKKFIDEWCRFYANGASARSAVGRRSFSIPSSQACAGCRTAFR